MIRSYTVVWNTRAVDRLAALWLENPAIRKEMAKAVDEIDGALARLPASVGKPIPNATGSTVTNRFVVLPPIAILFRIEEGDRQVQVISVKLWDD